MKKWIICFLLVLVYFYFGNGWYESSRLVFSGQVENTNTLLLVRWNSGEGFNGYEQRTFKPSSLQSSANEQSYVISIGSKARKNSASLSRDVVCTAIIADGKALDLASLRKNISFLNGELHFSSGESLALTVKATAHLGFKFATNNHSGIAFVSVNGKEQKHDLYIANVEAKYKQFDNWLLQADGAFSIEMDLPRYAIQDLEIVNANPDCPVQLHLAEIKSNRRVKTLLKKPVMMLGKVNFPNALDALHSFFYPFQFCLQLIFAGITTWILMSILAIYKKIGTVRACFFEKDRFVFWMMLGSSLMVFALWLFAFWPGVMSVDSLKIWRAAMLPNIYLNDHPVLNVVLYKYLFHIWRDPVVVPLLQIFLLGLLISWFFFWLFKKGASLYVLIPCFLGILFSVPVGTYNLMLWKDVPFALLVVFWACTLVKLYWQKYHGTLTLSKQHILVLLLLGVALGAIRHNGIVYLLILPIMFIMLRFVSFKKAVLFILIVGFAGGAGLVIVKNTDRFQGMDYVAKEIQHYAGDFSVLDVVESSDRVMKDYVTVLDFNHTQQKWDKFHYYFQDRYAYWFLLHSGWWKLYPYKKYTVPFPRLRQKLMKIYNKSYESPWTSFSWDPKWLLVVLPIVTLLFWWFPHTAILGIVLLGGALPLIYLRIFNWRYYYFLYLGLFFLLPLLNLDCIRKKNIRMAV